MANPEQLALIKQSVDGWNAWREQNPEIRPDLSGSDLTRANLSGANLFDADLSGTNLRLASLVSADLRDADLTRADLRAANLRWAILEEACLTAANLRQTNLRVADLSYSDLSGADLTIANLKGADLNNATLAGTFLVKANLAEANFTEADLTEADLTDALLGKANLTRAQLGVTDLTRVHLYESIFADVDLETAVGLDTCEHIGPSIIDFRTLSRSPSLPLSFLRGCGLPDSLIEYLPSLRGDALQFYSCFISYSSKDQMFADRLHADLQNAGVRCWFAPHDLPIGAKAWDAIDEAIRLRDKLLVILSKASISSDWVEDEVNKAYAEERDRNTTVLFPVRIDDVVMRTPEPWARKLRDQRNIGNFRQWKNVEQYQQSLKRLLRDLKLTTIK
jgi:TIR domain/Pentapeptide repeats (8 copies)